MKAINVCLVGYMHTTPVARIVLGKFFNASDAHEFFKVMEASDTDSTERLKKNLDKFFGTFLTYRIQKEEVVL